MTQLTTDMTAKTTVAITGASAGIGRPVARQFGERGANVGLIARGQAGLDSPRAGSRRRAGRRCAKHAINGFTSSLRCELLHDHSGVQVTVLQMPGRPDNLNHPVDGPAGAHSAHGVFDDRSHPRSIQQWLSRHGWLAARAVAGSAVLAGVLSSRRPS